MLCGVNDTMDDPLNERTSDPGRIWLLNWVHKAQLLARPKDYSLFEAAQLFSVPLRAFSEKTGWLVVALSAFMILISPNELH
jgi:hypothetical protein